MADRYGQLVASIVFFKGIALGSYTVISYYSIFPFQINVVFLLCRIVLVGGWILLLVGGEKYWKPRPFILWERNTLNFFRGIVQCYFMVQIIIFGTIHDANTKPDSSKIECMILETWEEMSITQKADVLQRYVIRYQELYEVDNVVI